MYDRPKEDRAAPVPVDDRLAALLGPTATAALAQWASMKGLSFRWSRLFVNGRSAATVAAVYERSPGHAARMMILKHDVVPDGGAATAEYPRHREALEAAQAFLPHLTPLSHDPIPVGDGSWIIFQEFAGDGLSGTHVLTSLLAGLPGMDLPAVDTEQVRSDGASLARVCAGVIDRMVTDWAVAPDVEHERMSLFLRRHLADRTAPGNALGDLAARFSGSRVELEGEITALPNPFGLINDPPPGLDVLVPAIIGKGHGDLHTENILVDDDPARFWLVDLTRYRPDAPLTQDPVQLVLSVVNRTLATLPDDAREALLRVLTVPTEPEPWTHLPGWLSALIRGVHETCLGWIARSHLRDAWQQNLILSTVACSLILAARKSTSPDNRTWFVRLAARSALAFAATIDSGQWPDAYEHAHPRTYAANSPPSPPPGRHTGLAQLCAMVWDLRQQARPLDRTADVERLVNQARLGHDIRTELAELVSALDPDCVRGWLGSLRGGTLSVEEFGCPNLIPCERQGERLPGGREPFCHVAKRVMARTVRTL